MISAIKTTDLNLVKETITQPYIYGPASDDGAPSPDDFSPVNSPLCHFVAMYKDEEYLGLYMLVHRNSVTLEIHTCLLDKARGELADECAQEILSWVWQNTEAQKVITEVPGTNRAAFSYAVRAGLKIYGLNTKAWLKNGVLDDLILLGISRPSAEMTKCLQ